jgi:hypothetical protein
MVICRIKMMIWMNQNFTNKWMDMIMIRINSFRMIKIKNKKKNKREKCMKERWKKEKWMKEK